MAYITVCKKLQLYVKLKKVSVKYITNYLLKIGEQNYIWVACVAGDLFGLFPQAHVVRKEQ